MNPDTPAPVPAAAPRSLKQRALSAAVWVLSGSVASGVIRLLTNLVLTRLLFPEAFGLMLMASTVIFIVIMLSDVGIQQSIIRAPHGDDPLYLDTAWFFQIARGWVLWVAASLLALMLHIAATSGWVPSGSTYADPALPWVIVVSSFGAVIQGFQATDLATASRRFIVKPVVLLEVATQLLGVVVIVALAWWIRSVWALVIAGLVTTFAHAALSHVVLRLHRNRLRIDRHFLAELFTFGKWLALSSAVSVFVTSGPGLIMGALVGPQMLGLFSIAINLASAFDGALNSLFSRVVLPAMSEVNRDQPERVAQTLHRLRWRIDPAMLLASGALFALAPAIIEFLYDDRYLAAGPMLQVLSLALAFGRFSVAQQVYLALNEPRYQVVLNVARAVSLYVTVPVAFHFYGLSGAMVAIALREVVSIPLIFWFNSKHQLNNFRLELLWWLFWPLGWLSGAAVLSVKTWIEGML
jgi:O-antigen/teichoic acid export membrane protein